MSKKASNSAAKRAHSAEKQPRLSAPIALLLCGIAFGWISTAAALAGRQHFVLGYATVSLGSPLMEPFFCSNLSFCFICGTGAAWLLLAWRSTDSCRSTAVAFMLAACLPLGISVLRAVGLPLPMAYWEPLWFAAWSGLSFAKLASRFQSATPHATLRFCWLAAGSLSALCAGWWYAQSVWYYEHFQLGFNDFAHFCQRIANTAAGRGFLLESPVLPPFWDHFNPGLLALLPLWCLTGSVHSIFVVQALCLACSAIGIFHIARSCGADATASLCWSAAWLAQPALGQMNVAYTYGWHPISLAVPLLLGSLASLLKGRIVLACGLAASGMLMEEGVVVVVACFCGAAFLQSFAPSRKADQEDDAQNTAPNTKESVRVILGLDRKTWATAAVVCAIAFGLIYQFSGIAEFQTGRFVALGDSLSEVLLSPLLNPSAFWGELFKPSKAYYLLSILLPCFIVSLLFGYRWLFTAVLPMGVLLVWDHPPASSLGFQYCSALLPVFWFASIRGAAKVDQWHAAAGALATSLILSLFVGQLPYSSPSINDVLAMTYGADAVTSRGPDTDLGQWLNKELTAIQNDGSPVLATSRIAAHLVGNEDVETVGQYLERKPDLQALAVRNGILNAIQQYKWLVLDKGEVLHQTSEQIAQVETEALQNGFVRKHEFAEFVILERAGQRTTKSVSSGL